MEMNTRMTTHIVGLARIGEEIGLCASLDTSIEERQAVLRHHGVIVIACDNLQFALQILGLRDQTALGKALRIAFGCAHIALTGPPATPTLKTSG